MTSASLNAMEATRPPAIVQPATRDWKFYENAIVKLDEDRGKMLKEYKEGETWKVHYKRWADACVPLNISRRRADELIEQEEESRRKSPAETKEDKEETLNKVANLPAPPKVEEMEEEEKPAVHSADEQKREEPKPRDNGKPVSCHHVWREMEELLGKCLNRADEANRVSPNRIEHRALIAEIKQLMANIRRWQSMA